MRHGPHQRVVTISWDVVGAVVACTVAGEGAYQVRHESPWEVGRTADGRGPVPMDKR